MHPLSETIVAQLDFEKWAATRNLEDITQEESLVRPSAGGNDINWIVGHIIAIRNLYLPALGEQAVWDEAKTRMYVRANPDTASRLPLDELRTALETTHERIVAGLGRADQSLFDQKAPFSPGNRNPDETIGSLTRKMIVHESYHIGQLGVLRRVVGREGAIRL